MEKPQIPMDDIDDIKELSENIENDIYKNLEGYDMNIAMSALISASINAITSQCETLDEIEFFKNIFIQTVDITFRDAQLKKPEKPPFS
jgi:hypothetical protein